MLYFLRFSVLYTYEETKNNPIQPPSISSIPTLLLTNKQFKIDKDS